jgi:DNA-binding NarL/FixJ family response regulator
MPVRNGIEAACQIRRVAPETKVVLLSMHDSPQVEKEANAVADGFVPKTEAVDKLLGVINELIGGSHS